MFAAFYDYRTKYVFLLLCHEPLVRSEVSKETSFSLITYFCHISFECGFEFKPWFGGSVRMLASVIPATISTRAVCQSVIMRASVQFTEIGIWLTVTTSDLENFASSNDWQQVIIFPIVQRLHSYDCTVIQGSDGGLQCFAQRVRGRQLWLGFMMSVQLLK